MESTLAHRSSRARIAALIAVSGLLFSNAIQAQTSGTACKRPAADPEIAALARSLNYDLSRIYEYIYYNVEFSPSYGLKKAPLATFLDRRGNNLDQNALFVALLKQSCIDASFRFGAVPIPTAGVANWMGVPNDVTLLNYVLGGGGFSANVTSETTTIATWWT